MSDIPGIPGVSGLKVDGSDLLRFTPEPRSALRNVFGSAVQGALSAIDGTVSNVVGIEPQYASLISEQIRQQEQMQLVSLFSNIEKSKHETQMAAIRNVRVG